MLKPEHRVEWASGEKRIKGKDQGEGNGKWTEGWSLLPTMHTMDKAVPGETEVNEGTVPVQMVLKSQQCCKRKIYLLTCDANLAGSDAC